MNGQQRLYHVATTTPRMGAALPGLPMAGTLMVRLLRICGASLGEFFDPAFRAVDLTEHGFHVLCLLVSHDSGTAAPSELSDLVGTSRPNMTRILEGLVRDGWVTRQTDSRDARRHVIALTDAGRSKVQDTVPRIAAPIRRAFADLEPAELGCLEALLRKLIVSLDKGATPPGTIT